MTRLVLLGLGALLALSLADCGRKGAPAAPGPADKIIYPQSYPPN